MNTRTYLPNLARFASPDTLIPDPANPQALNRYTYTLNNPVRFSDPTGHCSQDNVVEDIECWQAYGDAVGLLGNNFQLLADWDLEQLQALLF